MIIKSESRYFFAAERPEKSFSLILFLGSIVEEERKYSIGDMNMVIDLPTFIKMLFCC